MENLSWEDIRYFCALADHKSLRQAARSLGVSVETIRRRINSLEHTLGARLIRRHSHGLEITKTGTVVLKQARDAKSAIDLLTNTVGATIHNQAPKGNLQIAEDILNCWLNVSSAQLVSKISSVAASLKSIPLNSSVEFRKADITVSFSRPIDELDIICRQIGHMRFSLLVSESHPLLSSDSVELNALENYSIAVPTAYACQANDPLGQTRFIRTSGKSVLELDSSASLPVLLQKSEMVGLGLAANVSAFSNLRELSIVGIAIETQPVWLVFYPDVNDDKSSRELIDFLVDDFACAFTRQKDRHYGA